MPVRTITPLLSKLVIDADKDWLSKIITSVKLSAPDIYGVVTAAAALTMPAFAAGGNIIPTAGSDKYLGTTTSPFLDISGIYIRCTNSFRATASGCGLCAADVNAAYFCLYARDTDAALVEIARLQGAADPYFSCGGAQQFKFYNSGVGDFGSSEITNAKFTSPTLQGTVGAGTGLTMPGFVAGGAIDLNATELILDADADTSITADTDDVIDFKLGGIDYFKFYSGWWRNYRYSDVVNESPSLAGMRARGTEAAPEIVASADPAFQFYATGWDGANFQPMAVLEFCVDGTPGLNDMPGRIVFLTTPDGSANPAEAMQINQAKAMKFQGDLIMALDKDFYPVTSGQGDVGLATNKFANVYSLVVNAGDFCFDNHWRLTESERGGIALIRPDGSIAEEWV